MSWLSFLFPKQKENEQQCRYIILQHDDDAFEVRNICPSEGMGANSIHIEFFSSLEEAKELVHRCQQYDIESREAEEIKKLKGYPKEVK